MLICTDHSVEKRISPSDDTQAALSCGWFLWCFQCKSAMKSSRLTWMWMWIFLSAQCTWMISCWDSHDVFQCGWNPHRMLANVSSATHLQQNSGHCHSKHLGNSLIKICFISFLFIIRLPPYRRKAQGGDNCTQRLFPPKWRNGNHQAFNELLFSSQCLEIRHIKGLPFLM